MKLKFSLLVAAIATLAVAVVLNSGGGANDVETQVLQSAQAAPSRAQLQTNPVANATIIVTDMPVRDGAVPDQAPDGFEPGWDLDEARFTYNPDTDELEVEISGFGVIGDPEGNGNGSTWAQEWVDAGFDGEDVPNLGAREWVSMVIDVDQDGLADVIAGVHDGTDISGFAIAELSNPGLAAAPGLSFAYGAPLTDHIGQVPTEAPDAANPDLTFTIANFSSIVDTDERLDFGFNVQVGSSADLNIGEDAFTALGSFLEVEIDAELGDQVFFDENSNGINDPGEPGVPDVTVNLLDENGEVVQTTTTDDDGMFNFVTPPGTFTVEFVPGPGRSSTSPFQGTDPAVDSNADPMTGLSDPVTLGPGDRDFTIDAGLVDFVPVPGIDIEKATNGQDADTAPGVELIVGEQATFTFVVTNTGNVDLADIAVTDDVLGDICTIANLAVGASDTCETTATVTEGQTTNVATASGQPLDPTTGEPIGDPVTAEDPSNHIGVVPFEPAPSIDIEKATNGQDADTAPGVELIVGEQATFTFVATNTGNVDLVEVLITDDVLGRICDREIAVGQSVTCETTATVTEGQTTNVATVSGQPIDPITGEAFGDPVTDEDPSNHIGVVPFEPAPSIDIEKATNGQDADTAPGVELIVGEQATFTFVATNTGNVDLADVAITDDVLGDICTIGDLAVGASATCETTAVVEEGQTTNVATATGQPIDPATGEPVGDPVTADDPSNHIGVVDGPPCVANERGPRLWAGHRVVWDTGYDAAAGSTLVITTEEPGGSPGQPNEQVYVFVGDRMYGPTPVELGTIEIDVENTGRLSFVHYSVITGDDSMPNSVEIEFCGTGLSQTQTPACETNITGPRLHAGGDIQWNSGLHAEPGSVVRITTTEPGDSPDQPNEQVWVKVGPELFGPTPIGLGTLEFTAELGGEVLVLHFSRITGIDNQPNSVEFELCGTHLG